MPRPHALIPTVTGRLVDLDHPHADDIDIEDIAHSLSQICRFTGQTRVPYSVAEHSVLVSYKVPQPLALAALLHDAHEAYIGDISRGMKGALWCDELQQSNVELEDVDARIRHLVRFKFGVPVDDQPSIDEADHRMAATELAQLWTPEARERLGAEFTRRLGQPYDDVRIECLRPFQARMVFLLRYAELAFPDPVRGPSPIAAMVSAALHRRFIRGHMGDVTDAYDPDRDSPRHLAGAAQPGGAPFPGGEPFRNFPFRIIGGFLTPKTPAGAAQPGGAPLDRKDGQ